MDIEARDDGRNLAILGYMDHDGYQQFIGKQAVVEFLDWLMKERPPSWRTWAHYGGIYDFQFILREIIQRKSCGFECVARLRRGSMLSMDVWRGRKRWRFLDASMVFRASLAAIAEKIGLVKQRPDFDTCSDSELSDYNRSDCEILYRALIRAHAVIAETGVELVSSVGTVGLNLLKKNGYTPRAPWSVNEVCDSAYAGGRVETYKKSGGAGYVYDIRSAYPSILAHGPTPDKYLGSVIKPGTGKLGVCLATVEDTRNIPANWYRCGRMFYPTGKIVGWYPCNELDSMEQSGANVVRHKAHVFSQTLALSDTFRCLWELRRRHSGADSLVVKELLCALAGKFGERPTDRQIWVNPSASRMQSYVNKYGNEPVSPIPGVYLISRTRNVPWYHVALAAHTTGGARAALYDWTRLAQSTGAMVYAVDHDSIVTDALMPVGDELGNLELRASLSDIRAEGPALWDDAGPFVQAKGLPDPTREALNSYFSGQSSFSWKRLSRPWEALLLGKSAFPYLVRAKATWHPMGLTARKYTGSDSIPWAIDELLDKLGPRASMPSVED